MVMMKLRVPLERMMAAKTTVLKIPTGKLNIAGWNIPMLNRKYIFNPGPFFIALLVYQSVLFQAIS